MQLTHCAFPFLHMVGACRCCADATDFIARVRTFNATRLHIPFLFICQGGSDARVKTQSCSCNQYFISVFTAPRGFDVETMAVGELLAGLCMSLLLFAICKLRDSGHTDTVKCCYCCL